MNFAEKAYEIFHRATVSYHVAGDVDAPSIDPYESESIEAVLWEYIKVYCRMKMCNDPATNPVLYASGN